MKPDEHLFRTIRRLRRSADLTRFFGVAGLGVALTAVLARAAGSWYGPDCGLAVINWGLRAAPIAALVLVLLRRATDASTAARLDRRFHLHNRLESAVELRTGDHPIRQRQLAQTVQEWDKIATRRRALLHLPLPAALLWFAVAVVGAYLCYEGLAREKSAAATVAAAAQPHSDAGSDPAATPEPPRLEAALTLTYPDEKAEFMPIDLIEWEGTATGNAPWVELELRPIVNGRPLPAIPVAVPDAADAGGTRFPGGTVALDAWNVAPNDLISLQLAGSVEMDGTHRVFSAPVLLRIKPLRDELRIVDIPGGIPGAPFRDFHALVMEFIRRQTELLRLYYQARGEAERETPEADVLAMFALLAPEQCRLGEEVNSFVVAEREKEGPGTITAEMLLELNRAVAEMRSAGEAFGRIPTPESRPAALEDIPAAQQRALAALNASLQELTKAIRKRRDEPQPPATPDPEPQRRSNVLEQLDQAIRGETGVIGDFRANGIRPELAETQKVVTTILQALTLRRELSEATLAALAAAQQASEHAETAIPSNALRALESHTQEALNQMKTARQLLEKQSRASRSEALEQARRAVAAAQRENRRETAGDAEAAARGAEKLTEAAGTLRGAAEALAGTGSPADAKALTDAAGKLSDAAGKLGSLSRTEAAAELEQLRRMLKEAQGAADAGASAEELQRKLDQLRREAAYLAKHPEADATAWLEDLALRIQDLQDYLDAADPAHSQTEAGQLRERTAGIPNQLDGWLYAGIDAGDYGRIGEELGTISRLLDEMRQARTAPTEMFLFVPDQVPEEYRAPTAAYFETLSRRQPQPGKADPAPPSAPREQP